MEPGPRMSPPAIMRGTSSRSFEEWLRQAKAGARVCYFTGSLHEVRDVRIPGSKERTADAARVHRLASFVYDAAERGLVALVQIPVNRDDSARLKGYYYVAVRTRSPFKEKANEQQAVAA